MNLNENNSENYEQNNNSNNLRKILTPFFLANGFIYGMNSIYYSFIPKYLKEIAGKNEGEIGILLSIGPLIGIISMIFFGVAADKAKYKNNVLIFIIIASAIVFLALLLNNNFIYLGVIFSVLMFFMSPFGGLLDALALEFTTAAGLKYGPMRIMGSVCFGGFAFILSLIISNLGADVRIVFIAFIIFAIISVYSVKNMPKIQGFARGKSKVNYLDFFKDKTRVLILIFLFFEQFCFGSYNNFTQNYLAENGEAAWVWGLVVLFTIVGEIFFFGKFDYIFARFKLKHILVFSIFTQILRYVGFAYLKTGLAVLVISLATGSFCTVMVYAASYYINLTVKQEMRATGQTILYSISYYISRFLSGALGGFIVLNYNFNNLMLICAIINIVLILCASLLSFNEAVDKSKIE